MTHKQHMGRGSSATTMEISCTVAVCMISLFVCMVNASNSNLQLDVVESVADFRYQISLKGKLWFNSGPVSVRWNGSWYSTDDETLKLHNSSQFDGEDVWGKFQSMKQWWMSAEGSFSYVTYINKYYNDSVYVFVQEFLDGTDNASTGDDSQTISSFPSFLVEDLGLQRGYITWHGNQDKYLVADKWSSSVPVYGRPDGGLPLVIFDQDLQNTAVISPLTNFIEATQGTWYPKSANAPAVGIGLIGTVDSVPPKYAFKSVLVAGENITDTMAKWGSLMRRMYSKDGSYRKADYSINYLGYWTDNGACYYYNTGSYSNYEEAIIAVKEDADKQGIPFKYLQLDSWWYYKGVGNGVKNWTAMADVFPRGIEYVVQKTGWPIVAHNRFWSSNTDYAKQNGGDYDFVVDGNFALPNDSSFWHFLLSSSQQQWNLWVYEQDWLDTEYEGLKELRSDLFLGQTWLRQMGEAAQELGLTIQYCMPWPRHIMQSLEMPAVTQVRVSDDYRPGNTQWQIGHTTMLAHALGLAAFKDNFHTSEDQSKQGCKTPPEPYPALETYVTAMSGGPIGPSDAVGGANKTLIMATCMTDGRLLKPTRPGMLMDRTYIARAFGSDNGPDGELYVAYTEVTGYTWYHMLVAELNNAFVLLQQDFPPSKSYFPQSDFASVPFVAFQHDLNGVVKRMERIPSLSLPFFVQPCNRSDFQYWTIAPVFNDIEMVLIGEMNKVLTVSETRFQRIEYFENSYIVHMEGAPGEIVDISVYDYKSDIKTVTCQFSSSGTTVLRLPELFCGM